MNAVRTLVAVTVLALAAGASAQYSDLYIVPVAGHAPGAFGTAWRSDVVLHNLQLFPITVEIALVESGAAPSAAPVAMAMVDLLPGETRTLPDVAASLGRDVTGALIAGAGAPFAMTSRTWAESPRGRTIGQSVPPVAIAGAADAPGDVSILPALTTDRGQRSNVGLFVAATRAPLVLEIALRSATGASVGTHVVTVAEQGLVHRQLSMTPTDDAVTSIVRIVAGEGIAVPYASTIDNATAEAMFVSGQPVSSGFGARSLLFAGVRQR